MTQPFHSRERVRPMVPTVGTDARVVRGGWHRNILSAIGMLVSRDKPA